MIKAKSLEETSLEVRKRLRFGSEEYETWLNSVGYVNLPGEVQADVNHYQSLEPEVQKCMR